MVLIACLVVAVPEFALGLEFIAFIDLFGVELLMLYVFAPLWFYWYGFRLLARMVA